jgi:hypothetical protein
MVSKYEKRYGPRADGKGDKLYIARTKLPYSHAVWFEKEGWIDEKDDTFMNENVRGVVLKNREIHFYAGYDFCVNQKAEQYFFKSLQELSSRLKLKTQTFIQIDRRTNQDQTMETKKKLRKNRKNHKETKNNQKYKGDFNLSSNSRLGLLTFGLTPAVNFIY